jgi:hypothetical protein
LPTFHLLGEWFICCVYQYNVDRRKKYRKKGRIVENDVIPTTDIDDAVERMSVDEAIHAAEAIECNGRAWLKTLTPLLQALAGESWSRDSEVQGAIDGLIVAACCRAARICRSDVHATSTT